MDGKGRVTAYVDRALAPGESVLAGELSETRLLGLERRINKLCERPAALEHLILTAGLGKGKRLTELDLGVLDVVLGDPDAQLNSLLLMLKNEAKRLVRKLDEASPAQREALMEVYSLIMSAIIETTISLGQALSGGRPELEPVRHALAQRLRDDKHRG